MNTEQQFLDAIIAEPANAGICLAFADWLEEHGDPRAELVRIQEQLRAWGAKSPPERPAVEARMLELNSAGVKPIGPYWTNSIGMKFVLIPPCEFLMGSPETEENRDHLNEGPQHKVTLTTGFWLGQYPVTQTQYQKIIGNYPSDIS